jgi:RNA polymerase sigma factor (sigma-70 family)
MKPTDDGTLLRTAAHDIAAFETLYRRYVGQVTAWAVRRCPSAADVGDVVAQTFVRLLQVGERYDPTRGEPAAFLFTVAGGVLRDHFREQRRRHALVHRVAGRDLLGVDEIEALEAAIDAARLASSARSAIDEMTESEAEMVRMVAEGASPAEVARALGISDVAARGRLFRARKRIRSRLTESALATTTTSPHTSTSPTITRTPTPEEI